MRDRRTDGQMEWNQYTHNNFVVQRVWQQNNAKLQVSLRGIANDDIDTRSMYLQHGWAITSHSRLWDVITYPYPRYLGPIQYKDVILPV